MSTLAMVGLEHVNKARICIPNLLLISMSQIFLFQEGNCLSASQMKVMRKVRF